MSFIDPKAPLTNNAYAREFVGSMLNSYPRSSEEAAAQMPQAQEEYLARLLRHSLRKGVRPWELVDCTAGNDPDDIWIGLEWETGFRTMEEYRAAVQYMWQKHNNWAIDAEGIGNYYGEFTFPPINLTRWIEGKSMLDDMRQWMASKNIVTPRTWGEIEGRDSWRESDQDATDGWGCHVNISVPMTRDNKRRHVFMQGVITHLNSVMQEMDHTQEQCLFGRNPYDYGYNRCNPEGTQWWWEWKLFRTPVSDEEVENIRSVSTKLALLLGEYTTNPQKYFSNPTDQGSYYRYDVKVPTVDELFAYLSGSSDFVATQTTRLTSYKDAFSPYYFPSVNN